MPDEPAYLDRASQRDRKYEHECATFLASLTPRQIEEYKAAGVLREERDGRGRKTGRIFLADTGRDNGSDTCRDDDAATLFENSETLSTPEIVTVSADKLADLLAERFDLTVGQAEGIAAWHTERMKTEVAQEMSSVLRRVIGFFLLADNAKMCAHALAHAARMARLTGFSSLRKSAEAIGVTVEGLRKVAWKWVEMLNLPPLEGAKSPEARERYSADKKTNHWRNKTCTLENLNPSETAPAKHPPTPPSK